jgi:hypothetical protein
VSVVDRQATGIALHPSELGRSRALFVVLLALAAGCAPKRQAATATERVQSAPASAGDAVALHGYVGRSLIDAEMVPTQAGFHGCYRALGTSTRARLDGTLGAETAPSTAGSDAAQGGEGEAHEFDCRFESRSDIARLGGIVARCAALGDTSHARVWTLNGTFYAVKDGAATPFFLGPTQFPGVPDELMLALAHAEAPPRACAPFLDVLDVKSLPGNRRAVLYARSFPCEADAQNAGETRPEPALARLRLALLSKDDSAHPRVVPLTVDDDADAVELHVYEFVAGQEIFELERADEGLSGTNGAGYVNTRRTLFALTQSGRAGPLLELPEVQSVAGCNASDTVSLQRAELDGDAPPELVLAKDHHDKPCDSAALSSDPVSSTYAAYSFDPELGRFVPLAVESSELGQRELTGLDDVSEADDAWQAPRTEHSCSVPVAP